MKIWDNARRLRSACTFRAVMTSDVNIEFLATSASNESMCKRPNILAFSFCLLLESKCFSLPVNYR